MIEKTQDVKSKGNVVGVATYQKFDSTPDAVKSMGEATVVGIINAQVRTNAMNIVRADATGKPSSKALMRAAFTELVTSKTQEELAAMVGDDVAMNEALNVIIARMKDDAEQDGAEKVAEEVNEGEDLEEDIE